MAKRPRGGLLAIVVACVVMIWTRSTVGPRGLGTVFTVFPSRGLVRRVPPGGLPLAGCIPGRRLAWADASLASVISIMAAAVAAFALSGPTLWQRSAQNRAAVVCAALPHEELMKLVSAFPDNYDKDDMYDMKTAYKKLPGKIEGFIPDRFRSLVGAWKLEWSSSSGRGWKEKKSSTSLQSFGALPKVPVNFVGQYNRVSDGLYELIYPFSIPKSGGKAALVLAGSWEGGLPVPVGKSQVPPRSRVTVELKTARVVPSCSEQEESLAMLEATELYKFTTPADMKAQVVINDLDYANEEIFAQTSRDGAVQVFSRLDAAEMPFIMD